MSSTDERSAIDRPAFREDRRGSVSIVTIDRPAVRNALRMEAQADLIRRLRTIVDDETVRVVVLTGANDPTSPAERQAFCAGTDLSEPLVKLPSGVERLPSLVGLRGRVPIIAAINGHCVGMGVGLALAADLRVASRTASFRLPELPMGFVPANGGLRRLLLEIGRATAMEMVLLQGRLDAHRALALGLLNAVVDHDEVLSTAVRWAEHIADLPSMAVAASMYLAGGAPSSLTPEDFEQLESTVLEQLRQASAETTPE